MQAEDRAALRYFLQGGRDGIQKDEAERWSPLHAAAPRARLGQLLAGGALRDVDPFLVVQHDRWDRVKAGRSRRKGSAARSQALDQVTERSGDAPGRAGLNGAEPNLQRLSLGAGLGELGL
jgi:hypothetical protein